MKRSKNIFLVPDPTIIFSHNKKHTLSYYKNMFFLLRGDDMTLGSTIAYLKVLSIPMLLVRADLADEGDGGTQPAVDPRIGRQDRWRV